MPLKRIGSETVYRGRRIDIERHVFETASGERVEKEVGRHVGAVCVLPLLEDGRVVLIRNRRAAVDETLWELPAGTLEPPEPPVDCARRELREEAGYDCETLDPLLSFWTAPGLWDERMHAFVATGLTPAGLALEAGEEIEPVVVAWGEVEAMLSRGEIVDGKTLTALLYYRQFRQQSCA